MPSWASCGAKGKKSGSRVKAKVIKSPTAKILHAEVRENVKPGATLYTDAWEGSRGLDGDYEHLVIDHAVAYANDAIHNRKIWKTSGRILSAQSREPM